MNHNLAMAPARPQPGSACWRASAYGARVVFLHRYAGACAHVSRPGRFGRWGRREVEVPALELFATHADALAWCRWLRERRRRVQSASAPEAVA